MHSSDRILLKTLLQAHGLYEILEALSKICEELADEVVSYNASQAKEHMHRSVVLDQVAAELESTEVD